jgi:hypothetical protein
MTLGTQQWLRLPYVSEPARTHVASTTPPPVHTNVPRLHPAASSDGWEWGAPGWQIIAFSVELPRQPQAVSRAFPSWKRAIWTEIYLRHACSCHEIEDGNARV